MPNPSDRERMRQVCAEIVEDMQRDAITFDGKPFTGRTVAEYFGNQGAAIAALAKIVASLVGDLPASSESTP